MYLFKNIKYITLNIKLWLHCHLPSIVPIEKSAVTVSFFEGNEFFVLWLLLYVCVCLLKCH